jgi:hypothetical protein
MFELWFGQRVAPFAVPTFTLIAIGGLGLMLFRPPKEIDLSPTPSDTDVRNRPFVSRRCEIRRSASLSPDPPINRD